MRAMLCRTHAWFTISHSSPSPIPEPETYALLLAGLGLVAFMTRGREANKEVLI